MTACGSAIRNAHALRIGGLERNLFMRRTLSRQPNEGKVMFSADDPQPPDWELNRSAQRKFSMAVPLMIAVVVLSNVIGNQPADRWAEKQDFETAMVSK